MKLFKSFAMFVMLLATIGFSACNGGGGGGGSSDGSGTVSVGLTDSASDKYHAVYITVADVQICEKDTDNSSDDNCNWRSLQTENDEPLSNRTYNLLKLVNGVTEAIGSKEFDEGEYNQIRLIIGDTPEPENNLLGEPHEFANYLILNDDSNTIEPLKIPSGFQTGIKLVHRFVVEAGKIKELVLDFDADRSVVKAGNSGKYNLKPTIKVFETDDKIEVDGTVTDDSGTSIKNATVSAQISDGLSATVIRSTTTTEVGYYQLSLLSPDQIYNIVVYSDKEDTAGHLIYLPECQAFQYNDPDFNYPDLPLKHSLSNNDLGTGTIEGVVTLEGDDPEFSLVVTVYTELDCDREDGEGYVEITKADITAGSEDGEFSYLVKLPIYDSKDAKYYVVATADNHIPDTNDATLTDTNPDATGVNLVLKLAE